MRVIIAIVLLILASAANGVMDTLQFHYTRSRYAAMDTEFWNPAKSWTNKYKKGEDGKLIKPLKPKFWLSTTWLVWTTDAWHLAKTIEKALIRTAIVLLLLPILQIRKRKLLIACSLWAGIAILQALMFHLTYTILK